MPDDDFEDKVKCCYTLKSALSELEATKWHLEGFQKELKDIRERHDLPILMDFMLGRHIDDLRKNINRLEEMEKKCNCDTVEISARLLADPFKKK